MHAVAAKAIAIFRVMGITGRYDLIRGLRIDLDVSDGAGYA